jgi:hypothetical protein
MRFSNKILVITAILPLIAGLNGCASRLIGEHEGIDRVSLADSNQVSGCNSKGKRTVSVLAKIGFLNRNAEDVEANLYQLARNNAVDADADTIVRGESPEFGKRTFELYKCRP